MKNIILISIKETLPQLVQARKACSAGVAKRADMLIVLKKNPNISKIQLSEEVDLSLNSIRKWCKRYNQGGLERLLVSLPSGKESKSAAITPEIHKAIEHWLNNPASSRFTDLYAWVNKTYAPAIKINSFRKYTAKHLGAQLKNMKLLRTDITESYDELEKLYEKCSPFMKPRIRMLILLKKENSISPSDLSVKAGIAYNSVIKWNKLYKQGGLEKLLEVMRGKGRWDKHSVFNFPQEVYDAIEKQHIKKPFISYTELFHWTTKNLLPDIKYPQLLKHLHSHFGDKLRVDKTIKLDVDEKVDELESIYSQCLPRIKPRIKMLILIIKQQKVSFADLAKALDVTYGSVVKWHSLYKQKGLKGIIEFNRTSIIKSNLHNNIKEKLARKEFKDFASLFNWVKQNHLPGMNYHTLHRYTYRNFKTDIDLMKQILSVPVKESVESLEAMNKMNQPALKTRISMLIALKKNPQLKMLELSKMLNASATSIKKWCVLYEGGGTTNLLQVGKRGRRKFIMPTHLHTSIERYLSRNPGISIKELYDHISPDYPEALSYNKLYRYIRVNVNRASHKKEMKKHAA